MVTEAEEALSLEMPRTENMYALLGVSQMSPQRDIHKSCLCKTRKVLRSLKGKARPERDVLLKELRKLWIAHDILVDPVTRTDYDFRELGLRGTDANNIPIPEDHQSGRLGSRTPLRIGELLQCAGLLEMAELEIACDMHKAMPEVQFGTFLVKQGFIQERDLDSVLLGQRLLRDGKITVAQFQVAMELSQSRGVPISETLIEHGYLTAEDLVPEVAHEERGEPPDPVPSIREVPVRPKAQELMRAELNQGKSVPTWRDQLDWSRPIEVVDDHSVERAADKQSLARLLGGGAQADPNSVANENYPSWKDQLDWEKPDEYAVPPASLGSVDPSKQPSASHWHEQLDWSTPQEYAGDQSNASQEPRFPLEMFEPLPGEAPLSATPDMVPEISLANPSLGEVSESQAISSTGQPQFNPESLYSHLQNLGEAQELPAFNFDRQQGGPSSPSGETNALPESSLISARAFEYFSETAGHSGPEPGHMPESGASVVPDSTQQEPATTPEAEKRPPTRIESSKKKQFKNKKEVGSKKEDDNKKEDDAKKQVEAKKAADSKKEVDKRDKRKKRR
jgi:hypothetical protein